MVGKTGTYLIKLRLFSILKYNGFAGILILLSWNCFAQNNSNDYRFWNQTSLTGAISLKGQYRNEDRILGSGLSENIQGSLISGGILLESGSFIRHPNLLALDINVEYNPEKLSEQFLIIPDRSEVRTLKRFDLKTNFFQEKELTINTFANLNQNYINRESFTNSQTSRKFWGGGLFYKNKTLPFSINYQQGEWDQKEIETGRTYSYWQRNISSRISKSFFQTDKNELSFSHDEYIRKEANISSWETRNNYAELNSNIAFDAKKKYNFNTTISNFNQKGNDNLNRVQAFANLNMSLPMHFTFGANYNFFDIKDVLYRLDQQRYNINLGHKLYLSLKTNVFYEHAFQKHTLYNNYDTKAGLDINYTKKTLIGQLTLSYAFYSRYYKMESDPVSFQVINEEHTITDGQILLLNRPYSEPASVIITDNTGTIIYQKDLDYILIELNNYLQIQRIPGGQIANNSTILVDYTTTLLNSYNYISGNESFTASLLIFNQIAELYYRKAKQDYKNVENFESVTLNYFSQNVFGARLNLDFVNLGIEYDNYNSSIIPHQLMRYYTYLHWNYRNKLLFSANGNINHYLKISDRKNELYSDISGKIAYNINAETKLNFELSYRNQNGYQIDLELLTGKTELTMAIRKILLTIGIEIYRRDYLKRETINFNGAYINIIRKF